MSLQFTIVITDLEGDIQLNSDRELDEYIQRMYERVRERVNMTGSTGMEMNTVNQINQNMHNNTVASNETSLNNSENSESTFDSAGILQFFRTLSRLLQDTADNPAEPTGLKREVIEKIPKVKLSECGDRKNNECPICLEEYTRERKDRKYLKLVCEHVYHIRCVSKWFKTNKTCPLCKTDQDGKY